MPDEKKEKQSLEGWGTVIDPLADCQFEEKSGSLTFVVPGKYRDLMGMPDWRNTDAPRVLSEVQGDFRAQVLVRSFPKPQPKTAANAEHPFSYVSSGILVWQDKDNFLRLQRAANGDSGRLTIHGNHFAAGNVGSNAGYDVKDGDIYLRVERNAGRITQYYSYDGESWTIFTPKGNAPQFKENVKVGVFVINATTGKLTHQFKEFQLSK